MLLAADGAGKTMVLGSLRAAEVTATAVTLSSLDVTAIRHKLRRAIMAGGPVYLDALEIAARYVENLFFVLEDCLTTAEAVRVPWRLACRPAVWDAALAKALDSALPAFGQLRLLPLTRAAAVGVVSEVTSSPDEFLDEVVRVGMGRLAGSPLRLREAAVQWGKTGHLPESQLSAMEYEIEHLLEETGRLGETVPADRRRRIAGRLAAMSVFGRAERFTKSSRPLAGALQVAALPSSAEPDSAAEVTLSEVAEVLGTALFEAAGDATAGFRHQQYAEFLAADYVVSRRITWGQARALLGMSDDGVIPGPMIGCAAWLSVLNAEMGSDFAGANAGALAESAVELPARLRERVVDGILARAAAEDIDALPRQDLAALVHPGLESQLAEHLRGGLARPGELWWLARLAQAGQCRGLAAGLLREILARPRAAWACRAAVMAVAVLGSDAEIAQLSALACLTPGDDPDDDVLAAVIEALFPRVLDTTGLMELLRPQRTLNYLGPYRVLLGELSARIPVSGLPAALSWAAAHAADGDDVYDVLIPSLVKRGWDRQGAPGVLGPLAQLFTAMGVSPARDYRQRAAGRPWLDSPPGPRRDLAVRVAAGLLPERYFSLIDFGLLNSGDLGWLLRMLPSLARPEQEAMARCVPFLARQPSAAEADLILSMPVDHPAYAHTMWLRGEVTIDWPEARLRHRSAAAGGIGQGRGDLQAEQHRKLAAALDEAEADPGQWWRVATRLAPARPSVLELYSPDLTARPGWALLDTAQRQRVVDVGMKYLQVHELNPSSWRGQPTVHGGGFNDTLADWSGVYLLSTLARHAPARLDDIGPATWRAWAPAIVGAWVVGGDEAQEGRRQLASLVPGDERQSLLDAALGNLDALQAKGGDLRNWGLYEQVCPDLASALASRLATGHYSGALGENVMHLLVRCAPRDALQACRLITEAPGHVLAPAARRGLAELDPAALIGQLKASPVQADEFNTIAGHFEFSLLDDSRLADLAWLLLGYVPLASDPPVKLGISDPDPLHETRRTRRAVMEILAERGQERFFRDLAAQQDDGEQWPTSWYLRRARAQAIDRGYAGLTPSELLHLLGRADARLVRTGHDLRDAIILQLEDLQRELTKRGRSNMLWNFTRSGGKPKDENAITNEIADRLAVRLNAPGLLDREVEVTAGRRGIGTRIDLKATVPTVTRPPGTASVIIEAKLVTNKSLMTALADQLVEKYLIPTGSQYGIYLVYWAKPEQRPGSPADLARLQAELERQAAEAGGGVHVRSFILDISHS